MTEILLRKGLMALTPIDDAGKDVLSKIGHDDIVRVKISKPRNIQHSRKFFKLLDLIVDNTEQFESTDELRARLLVATGHCKRWMKDDGGWITVPDSMAFDKMDQTEFDLLYSQCINIVCTKIIPGIDKRALQEEVMELLS